MLNDRPPRSVDEAVATGERLSALLISEYLNQRHEGRRHQCRRGDRHGFCLRQCVSADGTHTIEGAQKILPYLDQRVSRR